MRSTSLFGIGAAAALALATAAFAQTAPPAGPSAPSGQAASVISLVEKACIPLVKGQDPKAVAAANGLKRSHDQLVLQLQGVQRILIDPPTQANPTVCTLTINHDVDQAQPIVDALSAWASSQTPRLTPLGVAFENSPGVKGWSWSADEGQLHEGLVLSVQKTPDGKPVGRGYDVSTLLFSLSGAQ
jgi:hypothetical protein